MAGRTLTGGMTIMTTFTYEVPAEMVAWVQERLACDEAKARATIRPFIHRLAVPPDDEPLTFVQDEVDIDYANLSLEPIEEVDEDLRTGYITAAYRGPRVTVDRQEVET